MAKSPCNICKNLIEGVRLHRVKIDGVAMFCCSHCIKEQLGFFPFRDSRRRVSIDSTGFNNI